MFTKTLKKFLEEIFLIKSIGCHECELRGVQVPQRSMVGGSGRIRQREKKKGGRPRDGGTGRFGARRGTNFLSGDPAGPQPCSPPSQGSLETVAAAILLPHMCPTLPGELQAAAVRRPRLAAAAASSRSQSATSRMICATRMRGEKPRRLRILVMSGTRWSMSSYPAS